jgi:Flp pilus assembly protein TadD
VNPGAACLAQGMRARTCFQRGVEMEPGNQKGHWLLGRAIEGLGLFDGALVECGRARALEPDSDVGRSGETEIRRRRRLFQRVERRG